MLPFPALQCEIREVYRPEIPVNLPVIGQVLISEVQIHAFVLALFASTVAPFGGFFASGFKRAFKIKDFGDTIPGHGGLTDRFDCQIMMAMFTCVYLSIIVFPKSPNVDRIMEQVVRLTVEERHHLLTMLKETLT